MYFGTSKPACDEHTSLKEMIQILIQVFTIDKDILKIRC